MTDGCARRSYSITAHATHRRSRRSRCSCNAVDAGPAHRLGCRPRCRCPCRWRRVAADDGSALTRVDQTELAFCDAEGPDFERSAAIFLQAAFGRGVRQVVLDRTLLGNRRDPIGVWREEVRQRPGDPLFVEAIDDPADLQALDFLAPIPTAVLLRPDVVRCDLGVLLDMRPAPGR